MDFHRVLLAKNAIEVRGVCQVYVPQLLNHIVFDFLDVTLFRLLDLELNKVFFD